MSQKSRSRGFATDVRAGRSLHEALTEAYQHTPHEAVVIAGVEMLAAEGAIDMKRLAIAAGMSRASLYRYYPERTELIAEIAGLGLEELVAAVAEIPVRADRVRCVGEYMLSHRAQTIAMVEMAETASPDALDTVSELLVGDRSLAPWFVGIASMCCGEDLDDEEIARIRCHIDGIAERGA